MTFHGFIGKIRAVVLHVLARIKTNNIPISVPSKTATIQYLQLYKPPIIHCPDPSSQKGIVIPTQIKKQAGNPTCF